MSAVIARTDASPAVRPRASLLDASVRMLSLFIAVASLIAGGFALATFSGQNHRTGTSSDMSVRYFEARADQAGDLGQLLRLVDAPGSVSINVFDRAPDSRLVMELRPNPTAPFWGVDQVIEVRLIRGSQFQLWVLPLAGASAAAAAIDVSASIRTTPSGVAFQLPAGADPYRVVASIDTASLWKPKVFLWPAADYERLKNGFHKFGGLLVGLFVGLAAFSVVVAIRNRSAVFLLFAAWLLTSLRLAAINGGWDFAWLGLTLDDTTNFLVMRVTLAAHAILSVALFLTLFRRHLKPAWVASIARLGALACFGLLVATPWLDYGVFMLAFYATAGIGLIAMLIGASHQLIARPSATAFWYATSYGVWVFGVISEMLFQSGMVHTLTAFLNVQTSSIFSALIMGIALAEKMRDDRRSRDQARLHAVQALQQVESNYEQTPMALFNVDADLQLRNSNAAFRELFRLREDDAASARALQELLGEAACSQIQLALRHQDEASLAVSRPTPLGPLWYQVRLRRRQAAIEGSIQDITARRAAEGRLQHLVDHDALTGALNRRGYENGLARALRRTSSHAPLVLAEVFVDRPLRLVELYGSAARSKILLHLHALVAEAFHDAHIARFGESFRLVIAGGDIDTVVPRLETLAATIRRTPLVPNRPTVRMSVGVGMLQINQGMALDRAQTYLARACVLARESEAGVITVLSDADQGLAEQFESMRALDHIESVPLEHNFFVMLQPVVSVKRPHDRLKFEVLLRMRSDSGDVIRPDRFLPVAEDAGIMHLIDRWVVEQALDLLQKNPVFCSRVDLLAVNLSGSSLNDPGFLDELLALLHARPALASKLCLEITETVALNDVVRTRAFLETVRALGVRVALDDFGSGYTGWGYLQHLPADILKLDGSIVRECQQRSVDRLIIRSAVDLARELGIVCVAEWAENEAAVRMLQSLGVEFVQGFHFAPPLSVDTVMAAENDLRKLLRAEPPWDGELASLSMPEGGAAADSASRGGVLETSHAQPATGSRSVPRLTEGETSVADRSGCVDG